MGEPVRFTPPHYIYLLGKKNKLNLKLETYEKIYQNRLLKQF